MDFDSLKEYEEREIVAISKNQSIISRIGLERPCSYLIGGMDAPLWSQIPFNDTLIFELKPVCKEVFEQGYQIKIDEIPQLIQLAKDTNRIKFVLSDFPSNFFGFDYMDPILEAFFPPMRSHVLEITHDENKALLKDTAEFLEILKYSPELNFLKYSISGRSILKEYVDEYGILRYLGCDGIADKIIENLLTEPKLATDLLTLSYSLLAHPIFDPFHANIMMNKNELKRAIELGITPDPSILVFPEIGTYLSKKIVNCPVDYETCKFMIGEYEKNDFYKVYASLNTAVRELDLEKILKNNQNFDENFDEILNNIWSDTSLIKQNADLYKNAAMVSCAILGYHFSGQLGLIFGIIGTMPKVSDYLNRISELIARNTASPTMMNIFDFQQKFNLK